MLVQLDHEENANVFMKIYRYQDLDKLDWYADDIAPHSVID